MDDEVEVDEMYYGKKKGSIGRNTKGKIVLMGIKKRRGKVIIKKIENASAESLIPIIEKNVSKNTTIYTDGWSSYRAIDKNKYTHKTVNHTKEFVNKEDRTIHTNAIENVWRNVRSYFKVYNRVKKNFNLFLQEVIFRINYTCYNDQHELLNKWSKA